MKFCKDCRHHRSVVGRFISDHYCDHPSTIRLDPVHGPVSTSQTCESMRRVRCGVDAKLFEPRPPTLNLFQRIMQFFAPKPPFKGGLG